MNDLIHGASFREMLTPADATAALDASGQHVVVVYKHSPICDLSERALIEMNEFLRDAPSSLDVRIVDVLAARPASQWVEARTGVRHESPQVLILERGEVVWNASHSRITAHALRQALAR